MPVIECDPAQARETLAAAGATIESGNTDHELWRATLDDAIAIGYDGQVVIQGASPERIEAILRDGKGRAHVYFDGASHGNPGPAAIGWVLVTDEGIVTEGNKTIGRATNNQAEYEALIRALEVAVDYGFETVHVRGDSELIIKQLRGEYQVSDPRLREYRVQAMELLDQFADWELTHVPRDVNERADSLATEALTDG